MDRNSKERIRRNEQDIRRLDDDRYPVFKRHKVSPIAVAEPATQMKILMILSHKYTTTGIPQYQLYNTIEMIPNDYFLSSTFPSTWDKSGTYSRLRDEGGNIGLTRSSTTDYEYYDLDIWNAGDTYLEGSVVEVKSSGSRAYKALVDNSNILPSSDDTVWEDITVESLDIGSSHFAKYVGTGVSGRLGRYDFMHSWPVKDNNGVLRYAGIGTSSHTRPFLVTSVPASNPIRGNMIYSLSDLVFDSGFRRVAQSGEPGYNVEILLLNTLSVATNKPSVGDVVHCTWFGNVWHYTQSPEIE